jgi:hypothetical protein
MLAINNPTLLKNNPVQLTGEENQSYFIILEDFFNCFQLNAINEMLWNWLVVAMSSETGVYNSGVSRSNLIYFYEKLQLLIESAHAIKKQYEEQYPNQS